jgi:hypothetical protein
MQRAGVLILVFASILSVKCAQFSQIENVTLVPRFPTNVTTMYNATCGQCLCQAFTDTSVAVNCFLGNNTCQLFNYIPSRYRLERASQARLYLIGGSLPPPSQCCMPDVDQLIEKLSTASIQSVDLTSPRCLVIDNHGFLVTVQEWQPYLHRFDPHNLTLIDTTTFSGSYMSNIAYHQGAYFLSTQSDTILIVNSTTRSVIRTVTASGLSGVRDMIFLKDGQVMIVASANNNQLFFFSRSNSSIRDYTYTSQMSVASVLVHGLAYVNDTFFYSTSWESTSIYYYTTNDDGVTWIETLLVSAQSLSMHHWGAHVTVDECQRLWLATSDIGLLIYGVQGRLLGNFNSTWNAIFDAVFMNNYVLLLADYSTGKIVRLDPQIEC